MPRPSHSSRFYHPHNNAGTNTKQNTVISNALVSINLYCNRRGRNTKSGNRNRRL